MKSCRSCRSRQPADDASNYCKDPDEPSLMTANAASSDDYSKFSSFAEGPPRWPWIVEDVAVEGTVKVHARCLSEENTLKTYVVTSKTSVKDLISVVLCGYGAVYTDPAIFSLALERASSGSAPLRVVKLHDTACPLALQSSYARGHTRFRVTLRDEAGKITVHDRTAQTADEHTVFMSETHDCGDVIKAVLRHKKQIRDQKEADTSLVLFEVNNKDDGAVQLARHHQPLRGTRVWHDPDHSHFEIRHLDDVTQSCPAVTDHDSNVKTIETHSAMSKLKYNLRKLREHLDHVSSKKSLPITATPDVAQAPFDDTEECIPTDDRESHRKWWSASMKENAADDVGAVVTTRLDHGSANTMPKRRTTTHAESHLLSTPPTLRRALSLVRPKPGALGGESHSNSAFSGTLGLNDSKLKNCYSSSDLSHHSSTNGPTLLRPVGRSASMGCQMNHIDSDTQRGLKSRPRRALPQVPLKTTKESLEEKTRRMAGEAVRRAVSRGGSASSKNALDHLPVELRSDFVFRCIHSADATGRIAPCRETNVLNGDSCEERGVVSLSYEQSGRGQQFDHAQTVDGIIYDRNEENVHCNQYGNDRLMSNTRVYEQYHTHDSHCPEGNKHIDNTYEHFNQTHRVNNYTSHATPGSPDENSISKASTEDYLLSTDWTTSASASSTGTPNAHQGAHSPFVSTEAMTHNGFTDSGRESALSHPSLHRILKRCDIHCVSLSRTHTGDFGIDFFESVFTDSLGLDSPNDSGIQTPCGKKPVIGRRPGGAFLPVCNNDSSLTLSLVAVDTIKNYAEIGEGDTLMEGDYILEVNGKYATHCSTEDVRSMFTSAHAMVILVVARSRTNSPSSTNQMNSDLSNRREVEKLRLKCDGLQLDAERYLDLITELKLQLQEQEASLNNYQLSMKEQAKYVENLNDQISENELIRVKYTSELNDSKAETSRLRFEGEKQEDRILQLRKLLIQHAEVLHTAGMKGDLGSPEPFGGERVSAV